MRERLHKAFLTPEQQIENPEFLMKLLHIGYTAENIAATGFFTSAKQKDSVAQILASFHWLPVGFNTADFYTDTSHCGQKIRF